uniref:Uncharacterized protein n=1 Tax=Tanacetum cinerariifolium TaxID=118510 RepID=A0A6L2P2H1_TANCI|nr:hypothetical protein [Tanacetum cinerariifolium]
MSYLPEYKEIDGGYVAFGGDPKRRVLVIKPHNKTSYELFHSRTPSLSFMRPFECPVTILNTLDHLGKFDGKANEGFFVRYSVTIKAFRVFNSRTKIVEETLHITFLENKPNVAGSGPTWLFDIDTLTKSMNYKPVVPGNQSNGSAGKARVETVPDKDYVLLPLWTQDLLFFSSSKDSSGDGFKPSGEEEKKDVKDPGNEDNEDNAVDEIIVYRCADDLNMPNLEEIVYSDDDEDDHLVEQIIGDIHVAPQTKRMTKNVTNHELKKVIQVLTDSSWIEVMQDELLQFKLQQVWTLVDLPYGKRAIGTKWIYRNKKDKRGIVVRNKAMMVTHGYTQEERIDYDEMDVKSAFLYDKIEEEVYVCQPLGLEDPEFSDRVYKVEKALYGLYQAPRAWMEMCNEFENMMHKKFQMSFIGKLTFFLGLQVTEKDDEIFNSQDKYMDEILKKFGFSTVKTASTPMETSKPLMKVKNTEDVDVYLYRSMIGPVIYLKGQTKLGLWYPKGSPFDLEAYTDSDYVVASLDRKCKKQTVVANSTIEAEYVAASNFIDRCYGSKIKC